MATAPHPDLRIDLDVITQQEALLRFTAFTADTAWALGSQLRTVLAARSAPATVEIELNRQVLFACTTLGATPGQADWVRRKRNTVARFHRSSYAVGRQLEIEGETLQSRHALSIADYAAHGGGFPLWLAASCVGSIAVSGLPQREDHNVVVAALAEHLGVAAPVLP